MRLILQTKIKTSNELCIKNNKVNVKDEFVTNDNNITVIINKSKNGNNENKDRIEYCADGVFKVVEYCFRSSNVPLNFVILMIKSELTIRVWEMNTNVMRSGKKYVIQT